MSGERAAPHGPEDPVGNGGSGSPAPAPQGPGPAPRDRRPEDPDGDPLPAAGDAPADAGVDDTGYADVGFDDTGSEDEDLAADDLEDEDPDDDRELAPEELLADLIADQEGARPPGASPCLSLPDGDGDGDAEHGGDAGAALDALLARRARRVLRLRRRGVDHGRVAVLTPPPDDVPLDGPGLRRRWAAARALTLPGLLRPEVAVPDPAARLEEGRALSRPPALERRVRRALAPTRGAWEARPGRVPPADRERDLERVEVVATGLVGRPELWAKSARLSNHPGDASLRVRLGFGAEGTDDASRDRARLLAVRDLAELLWPECEAVHRHRELRDLLEPWLGGPPLFTQHIAYWNAPEGGALFHHDAFDEPPAERQQAVCFVQLVGHTFWLVLPIEELAQHVTAFVRDLAQGAWPWVREALDPDPETWAHWLASTSDPLRLVHELALPGCGRFAPLVNQGPEFTGQLVDAGHGVLLGPGDGLLLPNHGHERTAMHSVWCADDGPTFGLSLAVRRDGPPRDAARGGGRGRPGRGRGRGRGRRRRGGGGGGGSSRRRGG